MAGFGTPYIWGLYPGFNMPWKGKHKLFKKWGCDVVSCVSLGGQSILYLADADLIHKINGNGSAYPKPVKEYTVLNYFGPNLVTATGADWRRQQSVSKTVFNYNGWCFLWDETHRIFENMMESTGWMDVPVGQDIHVKHAVDITLRVALLAIANAGFGMMMKWNDDVQDALTPGHTMSFQTALHIVAQSSILKLALPKWAFNLPLPRLRKIRTAFKELEVYIQDMIKEKKDEILGNKESEKPERHDLFHNLVRASLTGDQPLTDEELQGNIYIYML
ncbi:hypothetical protein FRC02_000528 [Tulasnella sp. 418]|nr:hypothetical protein FRC02_000528 [Tulasnella sp. 418]